MDVDVQGYTTLFSSFLIDFLPRLLGVFAMLFAAWLIAGWLARSVRKGLERARLDATLTKFFSNLARYAILIMAMLACLSIFGVATTSFAAVIGAAGLAIGLAFQGTLSNFSSGVMLLAFRPFKVGDAVQIGGITGKVFEIELFTTQLDTPDNRRFIIPNSVIFGSTIENITHHPIRRVDVNVGTEYPADLAQVRAVLEQVAATVEGGIAEPVPQVYLLALGSSSIDWVVRVWANTPDFWPVRERLTRDIKNALDAAEIGIPFPQMDVHLDYTPEG